MAYRTVQCRSVTAGKDRIGIYGRASNRLGDISTPAEDSIS